MRLLLFLSLLASKICSAQSTVWPEQFTVTASALKLREKPGLDSKTLATLPQSAALENLGVKTDDDRRWDKIDGKGAFWKHVRYNDQDGYVFGAYLTAPFQIFYENLAIEYLPKVKNWYGVYSTKQGDELRKIEVFTTLDTSETSTGLQHYLHSFTPVESRFIIATDRDLKTGIIGDYYNRKHPHQAPGETRYRYDFNPGTSLVLNTLTNTALCKPESAYELIGAGSFNLGTESIEQENFKIWVTHKKGAGSQFATKQDLTPFFNPQDKSCTIVWWGDLDGDGKSDVLINRCTHKDGGCRDYLFLSSEAKPGELLRPVAAFDWGFGC